MSVESVAAATGALILAYAFHESSGTALDDFSTSNLDATLQSRGQLGATAILTGQPRALTGLGGSGVLASRAVAGGSPLQVSQFTIMAAVRGPASAPASYSGLHGERNANWSSRLTSTRLMEARVVVGGVTSSPATTLTTIGSGERVWPWFGFDGTWLRAYTNDIFESEVRTPGSITQTTDVLNIGSTSNLAFAGDLEYWMMFSRLLDEGEVRQIIREGDATLDRAGLGEGPVLWDFTGDSNPLVAAAAEDVQCTFCGGRRRANQLTRQSSAGRKYHDGCRATRVTPRPATIDGSSTQDAYAARLDWLIRDQLDLLAKRATTAKTSYWNGTKWVVTGSADGVPHNAIGAGLAAATLARYLRTSRSDPLNRIAINSVESIMLYENQNVVWWQNADFWASVTGKLLVMLKDRMDPVLHAEWVDRFLQGWDDTQAGGTDSTGGVHGALKPGSWYVNGNREIGNCNAAWCAWRLTGDSARQTDYETAVTWTVSPTAGAWSPAGLTHGWVQAVAPTQNDWSDGEGWFREAHDTTAKGFWITGTNTTHETGVYETVDVNGEDATYGRLQAQYACHLAVLSGELRWWRYTNALRNHLFNTRYNATGGVVGNAQPGQVNGQGGARTVSTDSWHPHLELAATFSGKRAASIDASAMATRWTTFESNIRSGGRNPDAGAQFHRTMGMDFSTLLMSLAKWPGN